MRLIDFILNLFSKGPDPLKDEILREYEEHFEDDLYCMDDDFDDGFLF